MVHDEPPTCGAFVVDVGGKTEGLGRSLRSLNRDGFDQGVGRAHHAVECDAARVTDMQPTIGENLLPGLFDGMMADQPQPSRVNADDFLVVGPNLHEHGQVSLFERVVKGMLCSLGRGKAGRHGNVLSDRGCARQRQGPACIWCRSRDNEPSRSW